jgi:hypothetical protein
MDPHFNAPGSKTQQRECIERYLGARLMTIAI